MAEERNSGAGLFFAAIKLGSFGWAWATTPSFTGLKGVFAAALVGGGTTAIAALCAIGGGLALGAVGLIFGRGGAAAGLLAGAFMGAAVGAYQGYGLTHDIVENGMEPRPPAQTQTIPQADLGLAVPLVPTVN